MALVNAVLSNEAWWSVVDALRAFVPADGSLATLIEGSIPERGTDPTLKTTINGMTELSQDSIVTRCIFTSPPIWGCKLAASSLQQQIAAAG